MCLYHSTWSNCFPWPVKPFNMLKSWPLASIKAYINNWGCLLKNIAFQLLLVLRHHWNTTSRCESSTWMVDIPQHKPRAECAVRLRISHCRIFTIRRYISSKRKMTHFLWGLDWRLVWEGEGLLGFLSGGSAAFFNSWKTKINNAVRKSNVTQDTSPLQHTGSWRNSSYRMARWRSKITWFRTTCRHKTLLTTLDFTQRGLCGFLKIKQIWHTLHPPSSSLG